MPVAPFTHTQAALLPTLTELIPLEPIFHTQDFGVTPSDFERRMAPEYWEIGASGRRYSREFILDFLAKIPRRCLIRMEIVRSRASATRSRHLSLDLHLAARRPSHPPIHHLAEDKRGLAHCLPSRDDCQFGKKQRGRFNDRQRMNSWL